MLAIEIDGDSHKSKKYLDYERDVLLRNYNIETIRYTANQVLTELDLIKNDLDRIIKEREKLVFCPPSVKGGCPPSADRGIWKKMLEFRI